MGQTQTDMIFYGLGPIGQAALRVATTDPLVRVAGAVDISEELTGKDAGLVSGVHELGVPVLPSLAQALNQAEGEPTCVAHATSSRVEDIAPQITEIVQAGLSVATTCEEMIDPWRSAPVLATRLDELAQAAGVCIHPAGVNPGHLMDRLPALVLHMVSDIRSIRVLRRVNSRTRRPQLRAKTGAGLDPGEFDNKARQGRLGHVGLMESLSFLARAQKRRILAEDRIVRPVVAEAETSLPEGTIPAGCALGALEEVTATLEGNVSVQLILQISVDAPEPVDEIRIDAEPPVVLRYEGGLAGGKATAAALVNGARLATTQPPGLSRV